MTTGTTIAFEHASRIGGGTDIADAGPAPDAATAANEAPAPQAAPAAPGRGADVAADHPFDVPPFAPSGRAKAAQDAKEYEARGLLNLIVLLTRCIEGTTGTVGEKQQWLRDIGDARGRVAELYRGGLSPIPLSDAVRRIIGPV